VESGAFSVDVERGLPVAVVRPRGQLDAYTAPDLQTALLSALAHQPAGVLIDASDLTVVDDVGLAVIASVARESERWPGTPFAVTGSSSLLASVEIQPDRDAPAAARSAVREFCEDQGVGGDGDAAQLVASELVTNAVLHARTPMEVTLRLVAPLLHIAVRDASVDRPRMSSDVDENAESGRGLLLVDALASSWGSLVLDSGKIVWATVRVRALDRFDL